MLALGLQNFMFAKISRKIGSFRTYLWLQAIMVIIYLAVAGFLIQRTSIDMPIFLLMLVTTVVGVIGLFSFIKGMEVGSVPVVSAVSSGWAAVTVILSILFLNERITTLQILSIFIIIVGVVVTSLDFKKIKSGVSKKATGMKYALITLFGWGFFFFLDSLLVSKLDWFYAALLVNISTLFVVLIYGRLTKNKFTIEKNSRSILPIIVVASTLNLIGTLAYNFGVTSNYTAIVAPLTSATPIVVILLAVFLLKEKLEPSKIIGIALVVAGAIALSL